MCLAIPARVVELTGSDAVVEVEGTRRAANLSMLKGVAIGDYVLVHAGFAIQKWTEQDMREYRSIIHEMGQLD